MKTVIGGGIGLGLPGFNISVGGGIGIGGRKGCKSHDPSKNWTQVHNVHDHEIVEIAKFAVYEVNQSHVNTLEFQFVVEAWVAHYDHTTEYSIEFAAKDHSYCSHKFHAVVVETTNGCLKTKNLVSFDQIE